MKRTFFPLLIAATAAVLCCSPADATAAASFVLKGRVLDAGGQPVAGGEVFLYDSPRIRRAADFISPMTDGDGRYRIEVPAGRYWGVARVRSGGKYGPLVPEGKHSGEAQEIEASAGGETVLDFTVADVREMSRGQRKSAEGYGRVAGRLLDRSGKPVRDAYAFARKEKNDERLPEYVSAWSDESGHYDISLPPGTYCLGGAAAFPPEKGAACAELVVGAGKIAIANDICINYSDSTVEKEHQSSTAD